MISQKKNKKLSLLILGCSHGTHKQCLKLWSLYRALKSDDFSDYLHNPVEFFDAVSLIRWTKCTSKDVGFATK
jgi:hypothetical protein